MIMLIRAFGLKILAVLVAVFLLFSLVWYIQSNAEQELITNQQIESIEKELVIRKEVNDILEENRVNNPDRDGSIALDRLRQRYRSTD